MTWGWVGKTAHQRMLQANGYQETEHSGCSSLKSSTSAFSAKNVFCHLTHSRRSFSVFIVFLHSYPESFFLFNMCVWKKKKCVCVLSGSIMSDFATLLAAAHQAPLSMGFPRQELLEWLAISSSRGSPWPRDWTHVPCIAGGFFTTEPPGNAFFPIIAF